MARVTRPGGVVVAEFYNPVSVRGLVKRLGPAGAISAARREDAVYTRFDAPWVIPRILPPSLRLETARGVRIVTPAAGVMRVPVVRDLVRRDRAAAGRHARRVLRRVLRRRPPEEPRVSLVTQHA